MKNKICPNCNTPFVNVKYNFGSQKVLQCQKCNLIIRYPVPSQKELDDIYTKEYFFNNNLLEKNFANCYGYINYSQEKKNRQQDYLEFFKLLRNYLPDSPRGTSLLDYGCGLGHLMEVAKNHDFHVYGIERNHYAVSYIKNQYNYAVKHVDEFENSDTFKKFDIITFFDIIEHLPDPQEALKMAFDKLKDDGILAILTTDMSSPTARILGKKFEDLRRLDHIHLFSKKNLTQFLLKNNFKTLQIKKFGQTFNMETLSNRLQNVSFILNKTCFFFLELFPFLKKYSLYINPGTKMLIFAKKIT